MQFLDRAILYLRDWIMLRMPIYGMASEWKSTWEMMKLYDKFQGSL